MPSLQDIYIFEMANNHQGSVEHGLRIVKEMGAIAKKHNINAAVKLQYRELDSFIHPKFQKENEGIKHVGRFLETRLTSDQFQEIIDAIHAEGMVSIVTPFDEASVQQCLDHSVQILKVASCSADDWPLLEAIKNANKPVIFSSGGKNLEQIDAVYSFFKRHLQQPFGLMHCVGTYPTQPEEVNMNVLEELKKRYPDIPVGYSGHEAPDNLITVSTAVANHPDMLERHVGVPTDTITLNKYSMNPAEVDKWVETAEIAKVMMGQHDKPENDVELKSMDELARGVWAKRPIAKGETITREDVFFAMPMQPGQISSGKFNHNVVATQDYAPDEPICEQPADKGAGYELRRILNEFRGFLLAHDISIGDNPTIEISHHYGIENFRETGALLVDVINRNYCKKILGQLPGQKHPKHKHEIKEETFHILWGSMKGELDGKPYELKQGETMLVRPDQWHTFETDTGVIFEEISTTSIHGDSTYEDDAINQMSRDQRKTTFKGWFDDLPARVQNTEKQSTEKGEAA